MAEVRCALRVVGGVFAGSGAPLTKRLCLLESDSFKHAMSMCRVVYARAMRVLSRGRNGVDEVGGE